MRFLVAFDKFKDCMSAGEACSIVGEEIAAAHPDAAIVQAPLTDGGEDFASILASTAGGRTEVVQTTNARGQPCDALLGWVPLESLEPELRAWLNLPVSGPLAIVEMAQASGLQQLSNELRDTRLATTYGTGVVLQHAINAGAAAILIGLGGSATSDLGLGALEALGLRYLDQNGLPIERLTPNDWPRLAAIAGPTHIDAPPVRIACDVDNPLHGPRGAAAIFGPQKGLPRASIEAFDKAAHVISARLCEHTRRLLDYREEAGAGAAGGIGFGLRCALPNASYVPGFELVKRWLRLESAIAEADWILTGEGRFDASSLHGKGPGTLVAEGLAAGKRVGVLAGSLKLPADAPTDPAFVAISPEDWPLERALAEGRTLLRNAARQLLDA